MRTYTAIPFRRRSFSTHVYIALDEAGREGARVLLDEENQRIAWEKQGFRTSAYQAAGKTAVEGIATQVNSVISVPEYPVMKKIIDALQ